MSSTGNYKFFPPPLPKKQSLAGSFSPHQLNNIDQGGVRERVVTGQNPPDGRPLGNKVLNF